MSRVLDRPLAVFIALHAGGTLVHFVHNALFLPAYPNLPSDWTPAVVLLGWIPIGLLGAAGCRLHAGGRVRVGLAVLALFGVLGFAGLLHYTLAAPSSHTLGMNGTIALESTTGLLVMLKLNRERARLSHTTP